VKTNLHILLVEDQIMPRVAAQSLLTTLGAEVKVAETGAQAIQLAKENHFDLVFMDLGLPDMDGFTTTEKNRQLPLPNGTVPIIALTAHDDKENQEHALNVGMQDFVTKPLTAEMTKSVLEKYCL
jgi:two-component system aerobic respiration control sensor histidine kinase ArcB